jgi:hypothetical protein
MQLIIRLLQKKINRYLVVVDDLWDQSAWNIISCAFPEDGNGSRITVTTRLSDVAFGVCLHDHECIYKMNPLLEQDSRMLFFNRVFGLKMDVHPNLKKFQLKF